MSNTEPSQDQVIIVETKAGKRDQVEVRGDTAYLWRYKSTDQPFCHVQDIAKWRACTGFDY